MDPLYDEGTITAVRTLKQAVVALAGLMALDSRQAIDAWQQAVDTRLLPRLMPEFPLVAAVCGGGSAGKSTLFNTLAGETISPTGGRAGINRRILMALSASHEPFPDIAAALCDPFDGPPRQLTAMEQLTTPGDPLIHYAHGLPTGLALLDTPDFDTGAQGSYQNREMAECSLRAADVLIYIFTNANYNNRDNTDFITRMLTTVGIRKCFLVYRVDAGFTDREVLDHAGTVARNLYGDLARQHVLGIFRTGEDNRVAAGQRPMSIIPVGDNRRELLEALVRMDPQQVRGDLQRSIFSDVVQQGRLFLQDARESKAHLKLYLEGLRRVQRVCVQQALGHLPMDAVVRRFSEIWQATDPAHVKIMRKTGQVVETPVRLLMRLARWVGGGTRKSGLPVGNEAAAAMEADLLQAAGRLRQAAVDPAIGLDLDETDPSAAGLRETAMQLVDKGGVTRQRIATGGFRFQVPLHPAIDATQTALRDANWSAITAAMLARQTTLLSLTSQLEGELQRLAGEQRARMTTTDQLRQTFSAILNIIPATAAVTYVLHTGDPVGAVGIKVKLAGLFGLNDLYALVAIPATAGMKKADLKQLEAMLGPVAQAWLTHKLKAIEALFEDQITGALLQKGETVIDHADALIASLADSLARCGQVLEQQS